MRPKLCDLSASAIPALDLGGAMTTAVDQHFPQKFTEGA
jgi:hypothetical protein